MSLASEQLYNEAYQAGAASRDAEIEALKRELGECSGGYQTLEREVEALRKRVQELERGHGAACCETAQMQDRAERAEAELTKANDLLRDAVDALEEMLLIQGIKAKPEYYQLRKRIDASLKGGTT